MSLTKTFLVLKLKDTDIKLLDSLTVPVGFTRWIRSDDEEGRRELKEHLKHRILLEQEVWIAINISERGGELVGFAIIVNWPGLFRAKAIDAIEVAQPYRGMGVGSLLLGRILRDSETIFVLMFSPEPGMEVRLERFYRRFGFTFLNQDYMIYLPENRDKLVRWLRIVSELIDINNTVKQRIEEKLNSTP